MNIDDLYQYYFYDIYRFLLSLSNDHHVSEDLLQETFFRAYLHLENYNDEHVKTWLFTVARNAFIDHYRKQKRSIIKDQPFFTQYHDKDKPPLEQIMLNEDVQDIKKWLEHLPERQKQAILIRDFHDFSYQEGAKIMNVSIANFKVLLFRGRQAIRKRKAGDE
ncbi:MAG TPA: sigma-70 family RNA polymerase sigma factor [Bacillota bacterium]|nr:sigma-70 family RNA polymerase sigma factor [Bacillota bacterium]